MFVVGNGKCTGDFMWAGVRCGSDQDAWSIHAEILGYPSHHRYLSAPYLHFRTSDSPVLRTDH